MNCLKKTVKSLSPLLLILFLSVPSANGSEHTTNPTDLPDAAPVRLAIVITVDGLSWDRLTTFAPWYSAGLKRLLTEGQVESECRLHHLITQTGPGHASIACGAPPRVTGIVTDRWLEQTQQGNWSLVECTDQAWAPAPGAPPMFYKELLDDGEILVFAIEFQYQDFVRTQQRGIWAVRDDYGPKRERVVFDSEDAKHLYNLRHGKPQEPLATGIMPGGKNLCVHTLGDMFLTDHPSSLAITLSGTESGAVLMAGKNRDLLAYWYDEVSGRFLTSGAYDVANSSKIAARRAIVACSEQMAGKAMAQRYGGWWRRLPPPPLDPGAASLPMPVAGMWDFQIPTLGLGFDHDLARYSVDFYHGVANSPFVDELITDCALSLLTEDKLEIGRKNYPDLLMLSYSGVDAVLHNYGGESEEGLEALRRLDLNIGRLLTLAEEKIGKSKVIVALASPHGMSPIPEEIRRRDKKYQGGRVVVGDRVMADFVARLNRLIDEELLLNPRAKPIAAIEGWNVYYNRAELPMKNDGKVFNQEERVITVKDIDVTLVRIIKKYYREEFADVFLIRERAKWPEKDFLYELAHSSYDTERSGDAILIPREGVILTRDPGRGANHGSHYEYDLHVPLIFWGANVAPKQSNEPTTPYDLAPTLANYLATTLPEATGKAIITPLPVAPIGVRKTQ